MFRLTLAIIPLIHCFFSLLLFVSLTATCYSKLWHHTEFFFFFHFIYYYNPKLGNSFFHSHYTQANTHTQCKGDEWSCGYSAQWAVLGVGDLLKGTSAVPRMWASILQLPVHIVLIWSEWTSRAKSLRTELLPPILFTSASPWVHVWEEVVHQSKVEW